MFKKGLSIILSMAMLIALCPSMTTLGAMPTTELTLENSNKTVTKGTTGVSVDNFDHIAVGTTIKDYPKDNASTVFRSGTTAQNNPMTVVSAGDTSNPSDNVLLVKRSVNGSGTLRSKLFSVQSGYVSEVTYDIRFRALPTAENLGTATTNKFLGYDGSGGIDLTYDSSSAKWYLWSVGQGAAAGKLYPSLDKWYTVRATVDGNGLLKTYLMDKETGEVFVTADRSKCSGSAAFSGDDSKYFIFLWIPTKLAKTDNSFQVEINNARMAVYNQTANTPAVLKSSIDTELQAVPIDTTTIEVAFDQDIATKPATVNITSASGATVSAKVASVTNKLNTYTLTLTGVLEGSKQHTIDLSGFKNSAQASADNFTFTTAAAAPVVSSTPANGATDVSVGTKSMTVAFDQAMPEYPTEITLVNGINATVSANAGKNEFTISWTEELTHDTTYSLSLADFKNASDKASNTASISFKTEYLGIVTESADFETKAWSGDYKHQYEDGLLYHRRDDENVEQIFSQATGYDGGYALQLSTFSTRPNFTAFRTENPYSLAAGEKLVATYRFNLKNMAKYDTASGFGGASIGIGGASISTNVAYSTSAAQIVTRDGKPYIWNDSVGKENSAYLEENHWYNVYDVIESGKETFYFVDAQGENQGELVWKIERVKNNSGNALPTLSESAPAYIHVLYPARKTENGLVYNDSQNIVIDDFTLWKINPAVSQQKLTADVTGENGSYSMTFNQPVIANEDMLKVAVVEGSSPAEYNYDAPFAASFKYPDFCKMNVELSELPYLSQCVLDYSGIKGVSGAGFAQSVNCITAEFTTGADTRGEITLKGVAKIDEDGLKFALHNNGSSSVTPQIYAAYYNGDELVSVVLPSNPVVIATDADVTLDVPADEYTKIRIFVWSDTLKPLMNSYTKTVN